MPVSKACTGADVVRLSQVTEPLSKPWRRKAAGRKRELGKCPWVDTCTRITHPTGCGNPVAQALAFPSTQKTRTRRCHFGSEDVHACLCHAGVWPQSLCFSEGGVLERWARATPGLQPLVIRVKMTVPSSLCTLHFLSILSADVVSFCSAFLVSTGLRFSEDTCSCCHVLQPQRNTACSFRGNYN